MQPDRGVPEQPGALRLLDTHLLRGAERGAPPGGGAVSAPRAELPPVSCPFLSSRPPGPHRQQTHEVPGLGLPEPSRQGCVETVRCSGSTRRALPLGRAPGREAPSRLSLRRWLFPAGRGGGCGPGPAQGDAGSREDPALKSADPPARRRPGSRGAGWGAGRPGRLSPGIPRAAAVGTRPRRARPRGVGFPAGKAHRTGANGDVSDLLFPLTGVADKELVTIPIVGFFLKQLTVTLASV